MTGETVFQSPSFLIILFGTLSVMPFLVIATTSFVKLSAVLSILRSALGVPQIPPNIVITSLALILSFLIMKPTIVEIRTNLENTGMTCMEIDNGKQFQSMIKTVFECSCEPLSKFLLLHADPRELEMMGKMACEYDPAREGGYGFPDLIAAFLLTELKEAFQIGFLLFLPFIVIDMVVANILQALGMVMLSPTTISLPFKLLLFVMSDGWYLLAEGLLSGYL